MRSGFLNWYRIPESLSPREAESAVYAAKMSGADKIALFHEENVDPFSARYKEKLLALFRAALRHEVKIYLADDCFPYSGTAFGQLSSVTDLWARAVYEIDKKNLYEGEIPIWEEGEKCAVARVLPPRDEYPYSHYPDLLNPLAAEMVKESVYEKFIKEYKKFAGYEFAGFVISRPCFKPPSDDAIPYSESIKKYDIKEILKGGAEREKYFLHLADALEQNYILPLKELCEKYSMGLCIVPCEKGASRRFAEAESAVYILKDDDKNGINKEKSDGAEGAPGAYLLAEGIADFSTALVEKRPLALRLERWGETEKILGNMRESCEKWREKESIGRVLEDGEKIELEDGRDYTLINHSDDYLSVEITAGNERVVSDPEKDALYKFENGEYIFSPHAFLFVSQNAPDMFTEALPIRVGGVRTRPRPETARAIGFTEDEGGRISFRLPDFELSGKALEFTGEFDSVTIKIGSVKATLISPPYCVPLFDFYGGYSVSAEVLGGKIKTAAIV